MSESDDFVIYTEGLCYASVCTSLTDEEAAARMPSSGVSSAWQIADEPFKDGTPNGAPCDRTPATHRHLPFVC